MKHRGLCFKISTSNNDWSTPQSANWTGCQERLPGLAAIRLGSIVAANRSPQLAELLRLSKVPSRLTVTRPGSKLAYLF